MTHLQTPRLLLLLAALCCVALPALTGCGPSPTQPKPPIEIVAPVPVPTPPVPSPVPGTPASMLSISAFSVQLSRSPRSALFEYSPATLEVTETSGTHSATLHELTLTTEGGSSEADCPDSREHVGPGERLNLVKRLVYCAPYVLAPGEVAAVTFTAKFVDEKNVGGQVQKTISVAGCTLAGATGSTICK